MITTIEAKKQENSSNNENLFAALEGLPQIFRDTPQWVCWRFHEADGRRTKLPTDAQGRKVSATDPRNFMSFGDALAAYQDNDKLDGIGFALTPDAGLCCIDLDHCFNDGRLLTQAWMVLKDIGATYTELSPSGEGLHVWIKGNLPNEEGGRKFKAPDGTGIEIYHHGHYFTMTGNRFEVTGYPHHPQVEARQAQINALIERLERAKNGAPAPTTPAHPSAPAPPNTPTGEAQSPAAGGDWRSIALDFSHMTDEDMAIAGRVFAGRGKEALALWEGDISGYPGPDGKPDHSAADQAFANFLAEETQDPRQICRIFSASKLADREKWQNRADYPKRTIREALDYAEQNSAAHDFAPYATTGDPHTYLADTARAAWAAQEAQRMQRNEEARRARIDEIKAGFWARRVSPKSSVENAPPERGHILRNYIVERTVGALSGAGGGGKSYQCLKFGMAITSGKQIEVFDPPEKGPVIYLSAEDDDGILWWRMHHLAAKYELSPYEVEEMERNFHPIDAGGFFKPIMGRDRNGNPYETEYCEALREIIADVDPALVIIDPKADFYGVEENANEDEAAWTGALKGMVQRDKRTAFLVVSHIAKGLDEEQREQAHAARGGTAFIDACRTAMNYVPARAAEIKRYNLPTDAFKLIYTKGNYHKWPDAVFFCKDDHGIPVLIDLETIELAKAKAAYEDAIRAVPAIAQAWQAKGGPLNKKKWERNNGQDLTDPAKPKPGREQLAHKSLTAFGISFDQVETAIAEAISRGYVRAVEGERTHGRGKPPIVIEFDHLPPELDEETEGGSL